MPKEVDLYTDGSSKGNPGPGGYGAILLFSDDEGKLHKKELSCGYASTTNNRMELLGVIAGLSAINQPCKVTVHTDSQYIAKAFNENWLSNWQKKNWKTSANKPVKNVDLWKKLLDLYNTHEVSFVWVKGHAGNEYNERCDELATTAADQDILLLEIDDGFETTNSAEMSTALQQNTLL